MNQVQQLQAESAVMAAYPLLWQFYSPAILNCSSSSWPHLIPAPPYLCWDCISVKLLKTSSWKFRSLWEKIHETFHFYLQPQQGLYANLSSSTWSLTTGDVFSFQSSMMILSKLTTEKCKTVESTAIFTVQMLYEAIYWQNNKKNNFKWSISSSRQIKNNE